LLPEPIRTRKSKIGFVTPEDVWLRHELNGEVDATFARASFIADWADLPRLRQAFAATRQHQGMVSHALFFRYFILEQWARQFLKPRASAASAARAGDPLPTVIG
jgi:hypothetical protein